MAAEWVWDKRPVAMSEDHAKMLVSQIVEAVLNQRQTDLLEHYRQFARLESDLTAARECEARLRAEITELRRHIATLNGLVATMAPGSGAQVFPHNGTGTLSPMPFSGGSHYPPYSDIPNIPPPPPLLDEGPLKNSSPTG